MTLPGGPAATGQTSERAFVSEVFHNLSQPLTALQCSLELSLLRDQTAEEFRRSVEASLQNAESLRQRLLLVRALNDADDRCDPAEAFDLAAMFRELHEEMLPVFEAAGQVFDLHLEAGTLVARGNRTKLLRAFFYFLEYLFRYSKRDGILAVHVHPEGIERVVIDVCSHSSLPVSSVGGDGALPFHRACEVEIARKTFRAAGGDLMQMSSRCDRSVWRATLALA